MHAYFSVNLVERDPCPNGFALVDPDKSGKKNQFDLVELAANIQTVITRRTNPLSNTEPLAFRISKSQFVLP